MYYQNYEDYMRQVLGYPINDPNIYETYDYRNDQMSQDTYSSRNQIAISLSEEEMRKCYPEIYHLVNPMVCKVCETNTQPITKELIEKMTDEVYMAIEDTSTTVNIRVNVPKAEENRTVNSNTSRNNNEEVRTSKARTERTGKNVSGNAENREVKTASTQSIESTRADETRFSNSTLRDLIKILILNQIFGNRPRPPRPPRPPFPGGPGMLPPRPPFPGGRPPMGPGGPGGRPPMMQPREYPDYLEF